MKRTKNSCGKLSDAHLLIVALWGWMPMATWTTYNRTFVSIGPVSGDKTTSTRKSKSKSKSAREKRQEDAAVLQVFF